MLYDSGFLSFSAAVGEVMVPAATVSFGGTPADAVSGAPAAAANGIFGLTFLSKYFLGVW